ncbi:unnamed protein product [Ilex paraguariensis]|uniref:Stomatal closure-related actin-binding protein Ig domain-containing protein n=1 Tax=Ilex paraguariensis TaxID=185542 RepID=A0ABC8RFB7_9AQUA
MSGATKAVYAPEPFDVGRSLQADIISDGQRITLTTTGPIDPVGLQVGIGAAEAVVEVRVSVLKKGRLPLWKCLRALWEARRTLRG